MASNGIRKHKRDCKAYGYHSSKKMTSPVSQQCQCLAPTMVALLGFWSVSCGDANRGKAGSGGACAPAKLMPGMGICNTQRQQRPSTTHAHTFHAPTARTLPGASLSVAVRKLKSLALNAHFFFSRALSRSRRLGVPATIAGGGDDTVS